MFFRYLSFVFFVCDIQTAYLDFVDFNGNLGNIDYRVQDCICQG
jgi:hypothetical protein